MLRKFLVAALVLVPRLFKRYPVQSKVNAPIVDLRSTVEANCLPLELPDPRRPIGVTWLKQRGLPPAALKLIALLQGAVDSP